MFISVNLVYFVSKWHKWGCLRDNMRCFITCVLLKIRSLEKNKYTSITIKINWCIRKCGKSPLRSIVLQKYYKSSHSILDRNKRGYLYHLHAYGTYKLNCGIFSLAKINFFSFYLLILFLIKSTFSKLELIYLFWDNSFVVDCMSQTS